MERLLRVAIVGGGASGLVVLKRFLEENEGLWDVTLFEQEAEIGGTWVYREHTGDEHTHVHSSMYKNLMTNLSKLAMPFLDYPFPTHYPNTMHHSQVREYLESYARDFQLYSHIRFRCCVQSIRPIDAKTPLSGGYIIQWIEQEQSHDAQFDYVVVANGHNSYPYTPLITGIDNFHGAVMHSHDYREPDLFQEQVVLLIGDGPSAVDISRDLLTTARHVHVSLKESGGPLRQSDKPGLSFHTQVERVNDQGLIVFQDGTMLCDHVDAIIFCTGYNLRMDFLDHSLGITVHRKHIDQLYLHILPLASHPHEGWRYWGTSPPASPPTLAFVGLPSQIVPFPLFDHQALFLRAVWSGAHLLPSLREMKELLQKEHKIRKKAKLPESCQHVLLEGQHHYYSQLSPSSHSALNPTPHSGRVRYGTLLCAAVVVGLAVLVGSLLYYNEKDSI